MYLVVGLAAVIIIGGGIYWYTQSQNNVVMAPTDNVQPTNNVADVPASIDTTTPAGKISYSAALKLYGDRRIQFDTACVSIPSEVTYKVGTVIMLDNRSAKARVIALDNVNYNLGAWGYTVATLTTKAALPHTISVDCGKGENQGRILLQK